MKTPESMRLFAVLAARGLLVATVLCSSPVVVAAQAIVFDGVAAVVGASGAGPDAEVILRSDVDLRARILWTAQRNRIATDVPPAFWLARALEQLIDESLIAREAERVRVVTPTALDQQAEREHLEEIAGGGQQLSTLVALLRVSQEELDRIIRRRALVAVFLRANLDRVTLISDADIERVYEHNRDQLGDRTLDDVRELIRARLIRDAVQTNVAQWVERLRARTTVNVFADYLHESSL